jgi:hypothetical protein
MAYTDKQVAAISGVSVRTLHFYDETELLKPRLTQIVLLPTNGKKEIRKCIAAKLNSHCC